MNTKNSDYKKVVSYQGKWNIKKSEGVIDVQTEDGVSHPTSKLSLAEYQGILNDFNLADSVQYDPNTTQYISTKKL